MSGGPRRYRRTLRPRANTIHGAAHNGAPSAGEPLIQIAGEIGDWWRPVDLEVREATPGGERALAIDLDLPVGVYAYKLLVNGVFELDAANPRTRSAGEHRNNVLSVGGAPEPILFAPAPPFIHEPGQGGVMLFAALRRGYGERLTLLWTETPGGPEQRGALELASEEGEHLVFRARLPASSTRLYVRFELEDGSIIGREGDPEGSPLAGEPFLVERKRASSNPPAWWKDAVVYTIFVDRFRPERGLTRWGSDPGPDRPAGGHLEGVRRALSELADLGVNTLYLTPLHVGASCHRYDLVDPLRVDPALGGEDALRKLLDDAHARGLRVIVDLALTHAGRGYPPYEDVLIHGRASRHAGLFQWTRGDHPELVHYGSRRDAPLLDLSSPEARDLAERATAYWAGLGVDGLRLDAAADVPLDLARSIRRRLRERRPEAVLVGEVVPLHAWRWVAEEAVDTATDFVFHAAVTDFVARRSIDAAELRRQLERIAWSRGGPPEASLRFVSTHDHPRLATLARLARGPERAPLGLLLLLTSPGVPALLYGEEIGLAASEAELQPENVWPDRMPMPLGHEAGDARTRALVRDLIALRRRVRALALGDTEILHAEGGVFVYRRSAGAEVVDIAVNVSDDRVEIAIEDDERPAASLLSSVGEASTDGPRVWLGPASGAVILRKVPDAAAGRRRLFVLANARLRDAEAAEGALSVRSRPSRIDLSVTERCNLSCHHCITLAPERTREGTARTLSPWLLDRLRGAFDTAAYVGFVHGGEPLAAPILFEVLTAIRAARGPNPTVIHLLTNGVLLTERTAARLIEAGVSSISVSLDGASPATNDAIRAGGRFDQITANVRRAASLRRALGADLRIGISSVLMQQNAGEIERLVELCAELGVDWLKLEEAVPATPFAARSLLRELGGPQSEGGRAGAAGEGERPVIQAIHRAVQRGRALGVNVVDHTADRSSFRCELPDDPSLEAAWRADEYANRSEIHPCRVPWEHACVEPNGDIKMGDFFGAVLGNLAAEPLSSIWNSPRALAERQRSLSARLCGMGPVTCGLIG